MKEDRQDESEAPREEDDEESAVAHVVAAENAEDDAHDGVGDDERGSRWPSPPHPLQLRPPPYEPPAPAAAASFADAVPALAVVTIRSSGGVSGTGGRAFMLMLPPTADRSEPGCQARGGCLDAFSPPLL